MKHKYSLEQLKDAIKTSFSYAQVLSKLSIVPAGGNYTTLKKRIKKENLDVSHFTSQGWSKGKNFKPKRPLDDYLSNKFEIQSHRLRLRLISEKIFSHACSSCHLTTWLGKPIPIELEHKDGNHSNNELSNLCLLCPNCHAQTSTYRGKNKSK